MIMTLSTCHIVVFVLLQNLTHHNIDYVTLNYLYIPCGWWWLVGWMVRFTWIILCRASARHARWQPVTKRKYCSWCGSRTTTESVVCRTVTEGVRAFTCRCALGSHTYCQFVHIWWHLINLHSLYAQTSCFFYVWKQEYKRTVRLMCNRICLCRINLVFQFDAIRLLFAMSVIKIGILQVQIKKRERRKAICTFRVFYTCFENAKLINFITNFKHVYYEPSNLFIASKCYNKIVHINLLLVI